MIIMSSVAIDYYKKRFGENLSAAFIHLVREVGEIALAMEKNNSNHIKLKITEAIALLEYIASRYDLDVDATMQSLYSHKLSKLGNT
jgi:NTP pyrophosphatase (non-canonical NTP hydrolase)